MLIIQEKNKVCWFLKILKSKHKRNISCKIIWKYFMKNTKKFMNIVYDDDGNWI